MPNLKRSFWSRVPVFLKILLYGSTVLGAMVLSVTWRGDRQARACREAWIAEAPAWRALGEHFDRWDAAHPVAPPPRLPDGGMDVQAEIEAVISGHNGNTARNAAEQLERGESLLIFLVRAPAEDDAAGQRIWSRLQAGQERVRRICRRR